MSPEIIWKPRPHHRPSAREWEALHMPCTPTSTGSGNATAVFSCECDTPALARELYRKSQIQAIDPRESEASRTKSKQWRITFDEPTGTHQAITLDDEDFGSRHRLFVDHGKGYIRKTPGMDRPGEEHRNALPGTISVDEMVLTGVGINEATVLYTYSCDLSVPEDFLVVSRGNIMSIGAMVNETVDPKAKEQEGSR